MRPRRRHRPDRPRFRRTPDAGITRRRDDETDGEAAPILHPSARAAVLQRLPIVVIAVIGIGLLLYPATSRWLTARAHAEQARSYSTAAEKAPDIVRERIVKEARTYNEHIGVQTLRDPYTDLKAVEATSSTYRKQLSLDGTDVMAAIRIPEIDVAIPIRHGTAEKTLAEGIGHLEGTSLPIGGADTNAVLTGHSGLPGASLFTDLHDLGKNDRIYIDVLGKALAYKVTLIKTVLPTETDLLRIVPGHDYLTLITCTPVGVNSHRLIIRAERTPVHDKEKRDIAGDTATVPFPWFVVAAAAAVAGAAGVLLSPVVRQRRRAATSPPPPNPADAE